jgi:GAF domain-containing protein
MVSTPDSPKTDLVRDDQEHLLPRLLDDVTGALENLAAVLAQEEELEIVLQRVCEQVVLAVPAVEHTTVTVLQDQKPRTCASTSDIVTGLDHVQYDAGEGPCLEAARTGRLLRVSTADAYERWPTFAAASAAEGMGSFLSAPIAIDGQHAAAINCYSSATEGFAELDERLLDLFTTAVAAALRAFQRYATARKLTEQLRTALESRAVIDQAKGVLMAVHRIDSGEAFTRLVEESQKENVKVRELAQRFLNQVTGDAG